MKNSQWRIVSLVLGWGMAAVVGTGGGTAAAGEPKVSKIGEIKITGEMTPAEVKAAEAAAEASQTAPAAPKAPPAPIPPASTVLAAPAQTVVTPTKTTTTTTTTTTTATTSSVAVPKKKIVEYNPASEVILAFNKEEVKPYIKIMGGEWLENTITGDPSHYKITARFDKKGDRIFVLGLFDRKVRRGPQEALSAVVLIDGVNILKRDEEVPVPEIDKADVSSFRKYPMDGLTVNATDTSGAQCYLKVIDAKEEYEFGPVKPFVIPASRSGRNLGRIDIFMFAGPAMPPEPGQVVRYGKPLTRFTLNLKEWSVD